MGPRTPCRVVQWIDLCSYKAVVWQTLFWRRKLMRTPEEVIQPSSSCSLFPVLHTALPSAQKFGHPHSKTYGRNWSEKGINAVGLFLFFSFYITGLALSWTHSDPGHPALVPAQGRRGTVPHLVVLVPVYADLNYSLSYKVQNLNLCSSLE